MKGGPAVKSLPLTTLLDLLGSISLIVAAALFVGQWTLPGAFGVVGACLIVLSWSIDRKSRKAVRR